MKYNRLLLFELIASKLHTDSYDKYYKELNTIIDRFTVNALLAENKSDLVSLRNFLDEQLQPIYNDLMHGVIDEAKYISIVETAMMYSIYRPDKAVDKYMANFNKNTELFGYKISDSFKKNKEGLTRLLVAKVSNGMEMGMTAREIKREIKVSKDRQLDHISNSVIRSIIGEARTRQSEAVYQTVEDDIISNGGYYEFVSVMDNRTSFLCRPLDGARFHKKLAEIPRDKRPKLHMNCRSRLVLRVKAKTRKRAGKQYQDNGDEFGTQFTDLTYEGWLKIQPKATQNKVLGTKLADMWRNGTSWGKIHDASKGRRFNIDTLKEI